MIDLETYLQSKGLQVERSGDQLRVKCWLRDHSGDGKRGRLYINNGHDPERVGLWECKVCPAPEGRGNLRTLLRFYGDEALLGDSRGLSGASVSRVLTAAAEFYASKLTDEHRAYLQVKRGLTDDTIEQRMLGSAPGGRAVIEYLLDRGFHIEEIQEAHLCEVRDGQVQKDHDFFYAGVITIPYLVNGAAYQIRGKEPAGKYRTPTHDKVRLFNTDTLVTADEVFICEGEFDAIMLEQLGFNAVGAPGNNTWKPEWSDYFTPQQRVRILYDPDQAGIDGAARVQALLPRAKNLRLPVPAGIEPKHVDPTWLVVEQGWNQASFLLRFSEELARTSDLMTPQMMFKQLDELEQMGGVLFGMGDLDKWMGKGITPGELFVLVAATNAGKTIFLLNLFQRMTMVPGQENLNILYMSLEQMGAAWADAVPKLWNFYNLDCDPEHARERCIEYWTPRIRVVTRKGVNEAQFIDCIKAYEDEMGARADIIACDYLGYLADSCKGDNPEQRNGNAAKFLHHTAQEFLVPIVAPHQANRVGEPGKKLEFKNLADSAHIERSCDWLVDLYAEDDRAFRDDDKDGISGTKNCTIMKTRHGQKGRKVMFKWAPYSIALVPLNEHGTKQRAGVDEAMAEIGWYNKKKLFPWQSVINSHRTGVHPVENRPAGRGHV